MNTNTDFSSTNSSNFESFTIEDVLEDRELQTVPESSDKTQQQMLSELRNQAENRALSMSQLTEPRKNKDDFVELVRSSNINYLKEKNKYVI